VLTEQNKLNDCFTFLFQHMKGALLEHCSWCTYVAHTFQQICLFPLDRHLRDQTLTILVELNCYRFKFCFACVCNWMISCICEKSRTIFFCFCFCFCFTNLKPFFVWGGLLFLSCCFFFPGFIYYCKCCINFSLHKLLSINLITLVAPLITHHFSDTIHFFLSPIQICHCLSSMFFFF